MANTTSNYTGSMSSSSSSSNTVIFMNGQILPDAIPNVGDLTTERWIERCSPPQRHRLTDLFWEWKVKGPPTIHCSLCRHCGSHKTLPWCFRYKKAYPFALLKRDKYHGHRYYSAKVSMCKAFQYSKITRIGTIRRMEGEIVAKATQIRQIQWNKLYPWEPVLTLPDYYALIKNKAGYIEAKAQYFQQREPPMIIHDNKLFTAKIKGPDPRVGDILQSSANGWVSKYKVTSPWSVHPLLPNEIVYMDGIQTEGADTTADSDDKAVTK